jgi:hypothetical protein
VDTIENSAQKLKLTLAKVLKNQLKDGRSKRSARRWLTAIKRDMNNSKMIQGFLKRTLFQKNQMARGYAFIDDEFNIIGLVLGGNHDLTKTLQELTQLQQQNGGNFWLLGGFGINVLVNAEMPEDLFRYRISTHPFLAPWGPLAHAVSGGIAKYLNAEGAAYCEEKIAPQLQPPASSMVQ